MGYKVAGLVLSSQSDTSAANGKVFVRVTLRILLNGDSKAGFSEVSPKNTADAVEIGGMIWQELFLANDRRMPKIGDIEVWEVDFSLYQDKPQVKIYSYLPADKQTEAYADLLKKLTPQARTSPEEVVCMFHNFFKCVEVEDKIIPPRIQFDHEMNKLLMDFLAELEQRGLMEAFKRVPAGEKMHHTTQGGLAEHIWQMVFMAISYQRTHEQLFPELVIDWPLVVMAIILHDAGKIVEYDATTLKWAPKAEGHLLTHLPWGALFVERWFPEEGDQIRKWKLQHCLLSHHGKELSPVAPLIPEALVLTTVDALSANMDIIRRTKENPALGYSRLLNGTPFTG